MAQVAVGTVRGVLVVAPGESAESLRHTHEVVEKWLRDGGPLVIDPGVVTHMVVSMAEARDEDRDAPAEPPDEVFVVKCSASVGGTSVSWNVRAFTDLKLAEEFRDRLQADSVKREGRLDLILTSSHSSVRYDVDTVVFEPPNQR